MLIKEKNNWILLLNNAEKKILQIKVHFYNKQNRKSFTLTILNIFHN